jgi:hypothetical protein
MEDSDGSNRTVDMDADDFREVDDDHRDPR